MASNDNPEDKQGLLEDTFNSEMQESIGALPDISTMSTAIRGEANLLRSQNFMDGPSSAMNGPSVTTMNTDRHGNSLMPPNSMMYTASHISTLHRSTAIYTTPEEAGGGGTGLIAGAMMIVNAALGAGLLNVPSAFHEGGGVFVANSVQAILLFFIYPSLCVLAYCSDFSKARTYQDIMSFMFGRRAERITACCITLYCFGTCTTFLIIMGDQFDQLFTFIFGHQFCYNWYLNRNFTMVAGAICFILPFCFPKKIDFLKGVSSVGVVAVMYVAVLIIVNYASGRYTPGEIKTRPTHWVDVFTVVPTLCFGYQCHVSTIPIYSCYKNRDMKTFLPSSFLAFCICIFMYSCAATFGYLTFGSLIHPDVLLSYDSSDPWVLVAIVAISIKTYTTYPVLCFCGNAAVTDLWVEYQETVRGVQEVDPRQKEKVRLTSVSIWFSVSLLTALFVPNITAVIKFLGCAAAIFIFILPGMCMIRLAEFSDGFTVGEPKKWLQFIGCGFVALGGFLFGVVSTNAINYNFFKKHADPAPLCYPASNSTMLAYQFLME